MFGIVDGDAYQPAMTHYTESAGGGLWDVLKDGFGVAADFYQSQANHKWEMEKLHYQSQIAGSRSGGFSMSPLMVGLAVFAVVGGVLVLRK